MRLLYPTAYFHPEQYSSGQMSQDLLDAMIKAGFEVTVITPSPTRNITRETARRYAHKSVERLLSGRLEIRRFPMLRERRNPLLRAIRYLFCHLVQYILAVRRGGADLIYAVSTPPTQGLLAARLKKRLNIPLVYNLQDVFPDSLVTTGLTKQGSLLYRIGRKLENSTYRNADMIITISQDMKRNIMGKGVPEEKIRVICNWIDTNRVVPISEEDNPLFNELGISKGKYRIVYAGNLGFAQGVDTVIEAAKALRQNPDVEFLIFGAGAEEEQLKISAQGLENVRFFPLLPIQRVAEVYSLGSACVVCCRKGTGNAGVPSKTWSIMATARPIIASFDKNSELAHIIEHNGCGICADANDVTAFYDAVMYAASHKTEMEQKGENARQFILSNLSKDVCIKQYIDAIKDTKYVMWANHGAETE